MTGFATGSAGAAGLLGGEPPLSPETIGRAPSNFDAPVPVIPLEELVGLKTVGAPAPAAALPGAPAAQDAALRRVVVRLLGGDEVEVATVEGRDAAVARAHSLVAELGEAERGGAWPEVSGRHLRPASILSVDVLLAE